MAENKFRSVFKDELNIYMEHRKSCGIKESGAITSLRKLDAFMAENCTEKSVTREHADKWKETMDGESPPGALQKSEQLKTVLSVPLPTGIRSVSLR